MQFHSLEQALNPDNHNLTIEGYPAPLRAVVLAKR
jgi:tRNA (mo5U34)-methyltransferase